MSHGTASSGGASSDPIRKILIGVLVAVVMIVAILAVKNSVPQPAGSIVALVLLVVGLAIGYKAIAGKSGAGGTAHAPAGGHGGHGTEGGVIALCALLFLGAVAFLFAEFTQVKLLNEQGAEKRRVARSAMREIPVTAYPGVATEIPITGGETSVVVPTSPIIMGYDNEPPFEYDGGPRVFPTRNGSYILKIWGKAGSGPVAVKVYVK